MNLLVIDSKNANGLDFVMRAQRDGHSVRWFFPRNEKNKWIGEGLATITRSLFSRACSYNAPSFKIAAHPIAVPVLVGREF
jgi:hypothetical protein